MDEREQLSSLKRGLRALTIANMEGRITASQLARRMELPRATAYRILDTLVAEGYMDRTANSKFYSLTNRVRGLAGGYREENPVANAARPVMRELCSQTSMPVGLIMPSRDSMVMQVSMDFEAPLAVVRYPEGTSFPMTYGPSGHVFLAHADRALRDRIIASDRAAAAARPQLFPGKLPTDADLDDVQRDGYAIEPGPYPLCQEGCLAVPIFLGGAYVASLTQRYIKRIMSPDQMLQSQLAPMKAAARDVERRLGKTTPASSNNAFAAQAA